MQLLRGNSRIIDWEDVWVSNPYPSSDVAHYRQHLPGSSRPRFVPALLLDGNKGLTQTIWTPKMVVQVDPGAILRRDVKTNRDNLALRVHTH